MFKKDGTQIRKPKAFVAGIEKNGYTQPIFDADGNEIEDPVAFLADMDVDSVEVDKSAPKKRKAPDDTPSDGILFKEDGTPIRNTSAYVVGIKKNGYTEKLFTAEGKEIKDPISYVEKRGISPKEGASSAKRQKTGGIFKADGTQVKNPSAYVAGIARNGYKEPLFDATGTKIRDPVKYMAAMDNGAGYKSMPAMMPMPMPMSLPWFGPKMGMPMPRMGPSMSAGLSTTLFTKDGAPIRKPEAYIEGIKKNGYKDAVYDAQGSYIKNPVAYVENALTHGSSTGGAKKSASQGGLMLFKADGTPIRKPKEYIAGIKEKGYKDPLFDANGKEIRDPVAYLAKAETNEEQKGSGQKNGGEGSSIGGA